MKKQTLALILVSASLLPSCGDNLTHVYDVSCLVAGEEAILCIPGLDQEKLLGVLDPTRLPLPGDRISVTYGRGGEIASYSIEESKKVPLCYFAVPGASTDDYPLKDESNERNVNPSNLIAEGYPLLKDWTFTLAKSGVFHAPERDSYYRGAKAFYPRYLLELPKVEEDTRKASFPEAIETASYSFSLQEERAITEGGTLTGLVVHEEAKDAYISLYPNLDIYIAKDEGYSVPLAEDGLKLYSLEGKKDFYVESFRGEKAYYAKDLG